MIHDLAHIDDSQNPAWFNGGTAQGLALNGVNQLLQLPTDAAFRNLINQNSACSLQVNNKGFFCFHNNYTSLLFSQALMFFQTNISEISTLAFISKINNPNDRRTGVAPFIGGNYVPARAKIVQNIVSYDGLKNSATSFVTGLNGRKVPNNLISGSPNILESDDVYLFNDIFYVGTSYINLSNIAGVFSNFRIYTSIVPANTFIKKYHQLPSPDNSTLPFSEWKCESLADFYTFGGNLYAKNTGTSGNGLNNGTGYDMQVIGYIDNVPNFATLL